jgi:aspartyl/asparaginyl-tRNA synthetase
MESYYTIEAEVRDYETHQDIINILESILPYIADNVIVLSNYK